MRKLNCFRFDQKMDPEAGEPTMDIRYQIRWQGKLRSGKISGLELSTKITELKDQILDTDLSIERNAMDIVLVDGNPQRVIDLPPTLNGIQHTKDAYFYVSTLTELSNLPAQNTNPESMGVKLHHPPPQ